MVAVVALLVLAGVKEDLAEATRLLKSAQEEAAVQVLTRSLDRSGLARSERAQLYLLLGIARLNLRDEEGCSLAFQRGIEADGEATLPAKIAPPRARELFDSAKLEVQRRQALPPVPEPKPEPAPSVVAAAAPLPTVVEPSKPATKTSRWLGLGLAVVGAGVGGTGGYFLASGSSLRAQAVTEPVAVTSAELFGRAQSSWAIGLTMLGVGAAMLVAGVVTALFL